MYTRMPTVNEKVTNERTQAQELNLLARQRVGDNLAQVLNAEAQFRTKSSQVLDPIGISQFEDGRRAFKYMDFQFDLAKDTPEIAYAREILSGMALLAYDADDKPIAILHTPVKDAVQSISGFANASVLSSAQFASEFGYSAPVSLELIDKTLYKNSQGADNRVFNEIDKILGGKVNHSVVPLAGRAKLVSIIESGNSDALVAIGAMAKKLRAAESAFLLLDLVPVESLKDVNELLDSHPFIANSLIDSMIKLTEYADVFIERVDFMVLPKLMAIKTSRMLVEFANFISKGGVLDADDESFIWFAGQLPFETYKHVSSFRSGSSAELPTEGQLPTDSFYKILDFHRRNPMLKESYAAGMEFMLALMLHRQKDDPTFLQGKLDKPGFYHAFNSGDQMNETTPTTNSEVDIARGYSAVMEIWNRFSPERKEVGISLNLVGIGNGRRFEGPLVQMLEENGVKISQLNAVDLNDLSAQFPANLAGRVRLSQGDITAEGFDMGDPVDVALLPWSILSDLTIKDDIRKLMDRLKAEWVIVDVPLPNGAHSYEQLIRSQLGIHQTPGVMVRSFEAADGAEISSMFNMSEVEELIYLFAQSGFIIENIPAESAELSQQIKEIIVDDSTLGTAREAQQDRKVWENWAYQAKSGDNVANRATFVLRQVGVEEALRRTGLSRSILSLLLSNQ